MDPNGTVSHLSIRRGVARQALLQSLKSFTGFSPCVAPAQKFRGEISSVDL